MAGKNKYTFESKIHVYRATKRMTQQELADLVGVSRQTAIDLNETAIIRLCCRHTVL